MRLVRFVHLIMCCVLEDYLADYLPGKISILALLASQFFFSFVIRWINMRLNAKKRAYIEELKERNGWTDEDVEREREKHAFLDMTDMQ